MEKKYRGIVIDKKFSQVLAKDYSSSYQPPQYSYNEVLFMLLMYNKVWCFKEENNPTKTSIRLEKEGLLDYIPTKDFNKESDKLRSIARMIRSGDRPSVALKKELGVVLHGDDMIFQENDPMDRNELENRAVEEWRYYKKYLNDLIMHYDDFVLNYLPVKDNSEYGFISYHGVDSVPHNFIYHNYDSEEWDRKFYETHERSSSDDRSETKWYKNEIEKAIFEEEYELFLDKMDPWQYQEFADQYLIELARFKSLLTFSSRHSIPTKCLLNNLTQTALPQTTITDETYNVYKIILDEVQFIPRLNSIDDVLRLREDKRIEDFRNAVEHWRHVILNENGDSEQKIRSDIKKANKELKKLNNVDKINSWVTYASLPLGLAETLFNGVFPQFSFFVSCVTAGIQFRNYNERKKHSWLLFGSAK